MTTLGVEPLTAEKINLPELLARAEKNAALQKEFKALDQKVAAKKSEVTVNKWLPQLEFKAYSGVIPDASINPNDVNDFSSSDFESDFDLGNLGPFVRLELDAMQPIYTFGKITAFEDMAKTGGSLAQTEKDKKSLEVGFLVKKAFYSYLLSTESVLALEDVAKKLEDARQKVEELLIKNADNVSETDRLKIRVFKVDVENRLAQANRGVQISRVSLQKLASLSEGWELESLALKPEKVTSLSKDLVIQKTLESEPQIAQLEAYIKLKEAEKRTIKADLFPAFFVGGKLEYAVAPGRTNVKNPYLKDEANFLNLGAVLGLKQDLGFHRTLNKLEDKEADLLLLKAKLEQLKVLKEVNVEQAFSEAVAAQAGIVANEDGLRAARSWLTSAGLAFNLGTADTKDVLESYAAYFKAKFDLSKSIYQLNLSLAELSQVSGLEVVDRLKRR